MRTVAVIAQKGGVGKTTLALHLGVEAAKGGPVVIIDTDPQSSAAQWADGREAQQPAVVACSPSRLAVSLYAARRSGARIAFIDTAPAVESPALAAVRAADFCLIVSRPGILDLRSIGINVEIAKLAGKPVALVINAAPAQGTQALVAGRDAGSRYGVEVCPIIIRQRAVFSHALVGSKCAQEVEPASKAAAEVAALWDWLARRPTGQNQSEAASMAADRNYSRELAVGNAPDGRQLRAPARGVSGIPRCDRARGYVVSDGTNWRVVVALRRALEDAGIEFIERGKRGGPGVRLRE